jgi:hypothetical protein
MIWVRWADAGMGGSLMSDGADLRPNKASLGVSERLHPIKYAIACPTRELDGTTYRDLKE